MTAHREDPRIEAAARVLYADNRSQYDSPEFEWLHPDMQSRYRAVVAKVIAAADAVDPRVAQLAEAQRQLTVWRELFNGGPDTSCRTVWQDGIECVSIPIGDIRAALVGSEQQ